jgi:LAO/AO transport system kinase
MAATRRSIRFCESVGLDYVSCSPYRGADRAARRRPGGVRSLAARDRLGGLSDHAIAATMLLRALFDVVLVETVGIGQSDADVALIADRSLLCVQPGSGDALQFMKAGIMEWPDVIAVTKADTGALARRARADVEGALGLAAFDGKGPRVCLVSARTGDGVDDLVSTLLTDVKIDRQGQAEHLLRDAVTRRFGSHGASLLDAQSGARPG